MVRLVHHEEANATGAREVANVNGQVLGRGENDVHLAGRQTRVDAGALVCGRLAREHSHAHAEGRKLVGEVVRLVGDERAKRIHEDAGTVPRERGSCGVHVEDERLPTARCHHAEGGAASLKTREGLPLRWEERILADEGAHQALRERAEVLGHRRRRRGRRLLRGTRCRRAALAGVLLATLLAGEERVNEAWAGGLLVPAVAVEDVLDHELWLRAALPGLVDRLEDEVYHAVCGAGARAVRHAKHDGRNR